MSDIKIVPMDAYIESSHFVDGLNDLLQEECSVFLETLHVHWNARGPGFYSLHKLTEEQYKVLLRNLDDLAENLRSLGENIRVNINPKTTRRVKSYLVDTCALHLSERHKALAALALKVSKCAESRGAKDIEDQLVQTAAYHRKQAWILKSVLPN